MSVIKTIRCDVCKKTEQEKEPNAGWPGWGALQGINLNGVDNPNLCPTHLGHVAELLSHTADSFMEKEDGVD